MPLVITYVFGRCHLPDTHIPRTYLQALVEVPCHQPTSLARCAHVMPDACSLWLMLLVVGRYLHTMRVGYGQWCHAMFDVGRPLCAS